MPDWLLEASGVVFALLYLILAIYQLRSCWVVGLLSSLLYLVVYFQASLYTESALQIFYAAASIYGFIMWSRPRSNDAASNEVIEVKSWTMHQHIIAAAVCCLPALVIAELLATHSNASYPYLDTMLTSFSILATLMTAWKLIENWIYWILIDLISALLYVAKDLYLTAGLFGIYVWMAYVGWRKWQRARLTCENSEAY